MKEVKHEQIETSTKERRIIGRNKQYFFSDILYLKTEKREEMFRKIHTNIVFNKQI